MIQSISHSMEYLRVRMHSTFYWKTEFPMKQLKKILYSWNLIFMGHLSNLIILTVAFFVLRLHPTIPFMQLRPRTNRLYCQKFNFNTLKPIFISLIIFIPLILSCNDQTAKKRLAGIINSEIKCPTELVAIKDSTHYSNDKFPSAVKLILFYDRRIVLYVILRI